MRFSQHLLILWISGLVTSYQHKASAAVNLKVEGNFVGSSVMGFLEPVKSHPSDRSMIVQNLMGSSTNVNYIFHNVNEEISHKITIENTSRQSINLILFGNLPLTSLVVKEISASNKVYYAGRSYSNIQSPHSFLPATTLKILPGVWTYEIKTSKIGNIGAVKLFLYSEKEFFLYEKEVLIYFSLVFGALTSLLLYNIFLLSVNKSANIFYFTMTCFFLGMVESVISGVNSQFSFDLFNLSSRLWPIFTTLSASFFALYLKDANYATHKIIGNRLFVVILLVGNSIAIGCVFLAEYLHYEVQIISILGVILVTGFMPYLFGRYKLIDNLVFISSFPMVVSTLVLIFQFSNLINVDFDLIKIQLISVVFFLLCLSIYTGNKTHKNRLEKVRLQEMITLGRSVQDLLLPKRLEGSSIELKYMFAYEPFEGKMSGDWIKYWRTKNGNHQFLLGDVTGKGPQAALAVSIISTVVDRCIRLDNDAKTALIQINKTLFSLLKGNMGSTASATTIFPSGEIILFNTAGIGWVVHERAKNRHILGRSGILGQRAFVEISEARIEAGSWSYIYTFSDGVCNGPRAVKYLSNHLNNVHAENLDSANLRKQVLGVSKSIGDPHDDKTFLMIQSQLV